MEYVFLEYIFPCGPNKKIQTYQALETVNNRFFTRPQHGVLIIILSFLVGLEFRHLLILLSNPVLVHLQHVVLILVGIIDLNYQVFHPLVKVTSHFCLLVHQNGRYDEQKKHGYSEEYNCLRLHSVMIYIIGRFYMQNFEMLFHFMQLIHNRTIENEHIAENTFMLKKRVAK